jgi:GWxTD domain-containing protein
MKILPRITVAVTFAAAMFTTAAFAQQSPKATEFCNGPAKWIMTDAESAQCKSLSTDEAAQNFIDLFWARRDPTPGTSANEFHDRFDALVTYADTRFVSGRTKGSMTELGHVLIVLGPPTRIQRSEPSAAAGSTRNTAPGQDALAGGAPEDAVSGTFARQLWIYEKAKSPTLPFPGNEFDVGFYDQFGNNEFKLSRGRYDVGGLMKQVVNANIVSPNLTEVPKPAPGVTQTTSRTTTSTTTTTTQPVTAAVADTGKITTAALQAAIAAVQGGTSTINKNTSGAYAEFVAPVSGEFYVPVGIVVPKSANVTADAVDTIFGQVFDANGNAVSSFEEKTTPTMSNGTLFADRAVSLPTGHYTAVIGVAKAGTPVAITNESFDVTNVGKDATGTSRLILTSNLAETADAAREKTGFSFGKMKLIPTTTFSKQDDLTFFIEVHNPGIDPATNGPKLQTKLELSGGKLPKPIPRQLADVQAAPLSGKPGPGQYAIIDSVPLSQIPSLVPGDYTLKVRVVDTVSKQTYNLEQSFRIVP